QAGQPRARSARRRSSARTRNRRSALGRRAVRSGESSSRLRLFIERPLTRPAAVLPSGLIRHGAFSAAPTAPRELTPVHAPPRGRCSGSEPTLFVLAARNDAEAGCHAVVATGEGAAVSHSAVSDCRSSLCFVCH